MGPFGLVPVEGGNRPCLAAVADDDDDDDDGYGGLGRLLLLKVLKERTYDGLLLRREFSTTVRNDATDDR